MLDSFGTRRPLVTSDRRTAMLSLVALGEELGMAAEVASLPYSLKVLLENLLRNEDGRTVTSTQIAGLAAWGTEGPIGGGPIGGGPIGGEVAFRPSRVLMQDLTGVPALVDLAAMREGIEALGAKAGAVNPLIPTDLVIDHSIIADVSGSPSAYLRNAEIELGRNRERYQFLRWGQVALDNLRVVPPNTGICHQINLEYLAQVVVDAGEVAYPDTVVGTDSHTPMVNGLGVLGWGVGGIEAEAAMLGQPIPLLVPRVIGFKLTGEMPEGTTATDLVLTVTEKLRSHGVVGTFVEFYGPGISRVPLATRATIGNMSPEYGSTCAIFPVDDETLRYLRFTGRPEAQVELVEVYTKAQGLFHDDSAREPRYSALIELDLSEVVPSIAGPSRPQDRIPLDLAKTRFRQEIARRRPLPAAAAGPEPPADGSGPAADGSGNTAAVADGHVVIAAITSCTNTSNPSVMVAAGLLARSAVARGLSPKPWVKTSLAPGSRVVMDYYARSGLDTDLSKLGFDLVGFGCTTCIGNSGPLLPGVAEAVAAGGLSVAAVLSGNRNFEGRIHPDVRLNYLASPPLVVAYALAGTVDIDLTTEPLGSAADGTPVFLRDIWPSAMDVERVIEESLLSEMFQTGYRDIFQGDATWEELSVERSSTFAWDAGSTYVKRPPYFEDMPERPSVPTDIEGARVLAFLGDSVTTDHISPAGTISAGTPAARYLAEHGVAASEFNSYGSRRGNHEVMIRGSFANVRLRNLLLDGVEGGMTVFHPSGDTMSIFDASVRYAELGTPLVVLAGKEYGSGSSRDWAAKGTALLGVKAVIAEGFERIHRSNLLGMGVLPLELEAGTTLSSLGIDGTETFGVTGVAAAVEAGAAGMPAWVEVTAGPRAFRTRARLDTATEAEYYRHGGILRYVLRQLAARSR
ncbi:MAG: aconitate hydratase AcnA [Acidimicrobiales bacterium]